MSNHAAPRILITRLSHIGDCILTLPMLCALRDAFPEAHVAWAVESPSHHLLQAHPALDELIQVPRGWLKSPRTARTLRQKLRERRFDLVLDPQGLTKSAGLAWLAGAPRRIGLSRPWSRELAPWLYTEQVEPRREHIVPRTLELLRVFGIREPEVRFDLPIADEARQKTTEWIREQGFQRGFALINPGATWRSKQWELTRFAEVARMMLDRHGLPTWVLWAGDQEQAQAQQIAAQSAGAAHLAPPTTLPELAALAAVCRVFISGDTGPLHIAAATGAACIGLYGATRPERCGAYGPRCVNVQQAYQSGSAKQRRRADNRAMQAITVEHVCEAMERLELSRAPRVPHAA